MKVLYLGGVGPFGGASRSLYEAVAALPNGAVDPYFLMPHGTALDFYKRVAADTHAVRGVTRFDHTRAAHYRGLRWLVTLREIGYSPFMLAGLRKAARAWPRIDLIHVNEFTEIIPALLAKRLFRAPLVVHVRSLVETNARMRRTRWLHHVLRSEADAIVAIDETVRASLPADLPVDVIHNSFTAEPNERPDVAYLQQLATLRPSALKVGFVGNLLRTKGIIELARAAGLIRRQGGDVQFLIVGGAIAPVKGLRGLALRRAGLANNVSEELARVISEEGIQDDFRLLGPTPDIQRIYPEMDVIAFPSHLDSPGRPVFEAAFFGVPSIVAVRHPTEDTLVHNETAIAIPAPDPQLIADAIMHFDRDRAEVRRMGDRARALADRLYRPDANARALLQVYHRVLAGKSAKRQGTD